MDMRKIRQKVSLREWDERIHARQLSGQTVAAWCEAHGIAVHAYYYWLRKLREEVVRQAEESSATTLVPTFAQIEDPGRLLTGEDPRIHLSGRRPPCWSGLPGLLLEVAVGLSTWSKPLSV